MTAAAWFLPLFISFCVHFYLRVFFPLLFMLISFLAYFFLFFCHFFLSVFFSSFLCSFLFKCSFSSFSFYFKCIFSFFIFRFVLPLLSYFLLSCPSFAFRARHEWLAAPHRGLIKFFWVVSPAHRAEASANYQEAHGTTVKVPTTCARTPVNSCTWSQNRLWMQGSLVSVSLSIVH